MRVTARELFLAFMWMGLCGFGGVMPWSYHILVERKQWLNEEEFAEMLTLGQILPGPNITNMAVMLGYRFSGIRGAGAAVLGLFGMPFVIVLLLGALYGYFEHIPAVRGALQGMTAVAVGLIAVTAVKLAMKQTWTFWAGFLGFSLFLVVGVLHWPLLPWMLALMLLAIFMEWRRHS